MSYKQIEQDIQRTRAQIEKNEEQYQQMAKLTHLFIGLSILFLILAALVWLFK